MFWVNLHRGEVTWNSCDPAGTRSVDAGGSPSWFDPEKLDAETQVILTSQFFIDHSYCTMIGCKKQNTSKYQCFIDHSYWFSHEKLAVRWIQWYKYRDYRNKCWWPYLGTSLGMRYSMGNPQNGQIIKPRYNQIYVSYVSCVCISYVYPSYLHGLNSFEDTETATELLQQKRF